MPKRDPITGRIIQDNPVATVEVPVVEEIKIVEEKIEPEEIKEILKESKDEWTNVQVDSQVLSAFMGCPQRYDYVHNQHLRPIEGLSKSIIRGGTIHHAMLEYWKERIKTNDYEKAIGLAVKVAKERFEKEIKIDAEYKLDSLKNLLEFLKYIQSSSWIPLEAEKHFRVIIFEDEATKFRILLTGRIDLIMRTPQIPVLPIDVKTESERWFHSQMSNQYRIYCLACNVNLFGVQRVGFQTTLPPDQKFKLELLPFDQDVLEEFRTITLPFWVKRLIESHETGFYPMNTTDCVHGHFKCYFSDAYNGGICNVSRSVRQQKLDRYFVKGEEWDPSVVV